MFHTFTSLHSSLHFLSHKPNDASSIFSDSGTLTHCVLEQGDDTEYTEEKFVFAKQEPAVPDTVAESYLCGCWGIF